METDLVGRIPCALRRHATKGTRRHRAIFVTGEGAAPVLEERQFLGRFLHEVLDGVLVAQEVRTLDGVEAVEFKTVVLTGNRGRATFGGHGVASHRIDL